MAFDIGTVIDLGLIAGLCALMISGRVAPARAFALFALAVILLGRIDYQTAFASLGSPAIWAVVSLVVFSLALAKLPVMRQVFFGSRPRGLRATLSRLLGAAALTSAVVPNTAVVAAMLGPASRRPGISAHQLLLPLSYVALAAGMMTPFGTSASLMVVGQAAASDVSLGALDFLGPGLMVTMAALVTLLVAAPIILRERDGAEAVKPEVFHVEAYVEDSSKLIGSRVSEGRLSRLHSFFLAEIIRGDEVIAPVRPRQRVEAGDRLILVGDINHMDEIQNLPGVTILKEADTYKHDNVARAVVASGGLLDGRTLKEVNFQPRFDASVLGIQRAGASLSGKLGRIRLKAGDLLLLATGPDFQVRDNMRANLHLVDSDDAGLAQLGRRDTILLGLAFAGFLVAALFQLAPIAVGAVTLAAVAVLFDWVSAREVRRAFPFDLVLVLWGAVLLSLLVRQSGLSGAIADAVAYLSDGLPALAAAAAIFLMAWMLTEFFSNTSAALIALPVALDTAAITGHAPEAFALAAAFGASASFFMPFGYQTHLMVMNPGRYAMTDYWRLGAVVFLAYSCAALSGLALFHF